MGVWRGGGKRGLDSMPRTVGMVKAGAPRIRTFKQPFAMPGFRRCATGKKREIIAGSIGDAAIFERLQMIKQASILAAVVAVASALPVAGAQATHVRAARARDASRRPCCPPARATRGVVRRQVCTSASSPMPAIRSRMMIITTAIAASIATTMTIAWCSGRRSIHSAT